MRNIISIIIIKVVFFTSLLAQNPQVQNGIATYTANKNIGRKFLVPDSWNKIVIQENVTITGSFFMPSRTHPIEISGESRKTSILQGDGSRPTDDGIKGRTYSAIRCDKSPDLYVHDLKVTKPMKFHIHGGFGNVTVERCDIIAGSPTHTTDGIHGGRGKTVVKDCYIDVYDDALYTIECKLVENTTIVHNKNGGPFMTSWGADVPNNHVCVIRNCTVIDNYDGTNYNHGIFSWAGKNGNGQQVIHNKIEGTFTHKVNSGKKASIMYTIGRPNDGGISDAVMRIDGACLRQESVDTRTSNNSQVVFVNCNVNNNDTATGDVSSLKAEALGCNSVKLTWSDVNNEDQYRVRRKLPGGAYEILTDVTAGITTYTDNTVIASTTYEYMVRPMQSGVASGVSNISSIKTPSCNNDGDDSNTGGGNCNGADFEEKNGLVVIEMESANISGTSWKKETAANGYTGSGYLAWRGSNSFGKADKGVITIPVRINDPGTYIVRWRMAIKPEYSGPATEHNDSWLKIEGDRYYAVKNGAEIEPKPNCNNSSASCPEGGSDAGYFKMFGGGTNGKWQWQNKTSDFDDHFVRVDFNSPGVYNVKFAGRSEGHLLDRIILFKDGKVDQNTAQNLSNKETICTGGDGDNNDNNSGGGNTTCLDEVNFPGGRIALTFDGNEHDEDDVGAMPLSVAMIEAAGLIDKVVFMEHSNHHCDNQQDQYEDMLESAQGCIDRFSLDPGVVYDYQGNRASSTAAFADAINASTSNNKLWIIAAGPMESLWRALNASNSSARQYVTIISHSKWNQNHGDCGSNSHKWTDLKNDFPEPFYIESCNQTSNSCSASDEVKDNLLPDQNTSDNDNDFETPANKWSWLQNSSDPDLAWLYTRDKADGNNGIDYSDAGMVYYLITGATNGGNERAGWPEAKKLLENPCSGNDGTVGCTNGSTLGALVDFNNTNLGGNFKPAYKDDARNALAINAVNYKGDFAAAQTIYNGVDGTFDLKLNTLSELDGESKYRISINGNTLVGTFTNPKIFGTNDSDYTPASYTWKSVDLKSGDVIRVEFSSETNGEIPEGDITAYSRGRWTSLEIICTDEDNIDDCSFNASITSSSLVCGSAGSVSVTLSDFGTRTNVKYKLGNGPLTGNQNPADVFTFTNITTGTYDVYAEWGNGECANTKIGTVTASNDCAISDIVDLSLIQEDCDMILTWTDVPVADAYRIRRKLTREATYTNLGDVVPGVETYVDSDLEVGESYVYMVRPLENGVASKVSNTVEISIDQCTVTDLETSEKPVKTSLYPNPATSSLTLSSIVKWELVSPFFGTVGLGEGSYIDVSSLKPGTYFLILESGESYKFLKKYSGW